MRRATYSPYTHILSDITVFVDPFNIDTGLYEQVIIVWMLRRSHRLLSNKC